jgi:hypothetical protein
MSGLAQGPPFFYPAPRRQLPNLAGGGCVSGVDITEHRPRLERYTGSEEVSPLHDSDRLLEEGLARDSAPRIALGPSLCLTEKEVRVWIIRCNTTRSQALVCPG